MTKPYFALSHKQIHLLLEEVASYARLAENPFSAERDRGTIWGLL